MGWKSQHNSGVEIIVTSDYSAGEKIVQIVYVGVWELDENMTYLHCDFNIIWHVFFLFVDCLSQLTFFII